MKRIYLIMAIAIGMAACGENTGYDDTGTGGSIDSASTAPTTSPTDNTTVSPDTTTTMDTGQGRSLGTDTGTSGSNP